MICNAASTCPWAGRTDPQGCRHGVEHSWENVPNCHVPCDSPYGVSGSRCVEAPGVCMKVTCGTCREKDQVDNPHCPVSLRSSLQKKRDFLKLSVEERRPILQQQAEALGDYQVDDLGGLDEPKDELAFHVEVMVGDDAKDSDRIELLQSIVNDKDVAIHDLKSLLEMYKAELHKLIKMHDDELTGQAKGLFQAIGPLESLGLPVDAYTRLVNAKKRFGVEG